MVAMEVVLVDQKLFGLLVFLLFFLDFALFQYGILCFFLVFLSAFLPAGAFVAHGVFSFLTKPEEYSLEYHDHYTLLPG